MVVLSFSICSTPLMGLITTIFDHKAAIRLRGAFFFLSYSLLVILILLPHRNISYGILEMATPRNAPTTTA